MQQNTRGEDQSSALKVSQSLISEMFIIAIAESGISGQPQQMTDSLPIPSQPGHCLAAALGPIAGFLAVAGWSSAFVGIRSALRDIPPATLIVSRFAVAAACFAVVALVGWIRRPHARDLPQLLLLGLVGQGAYQWALCIAETSITAGTASFLLATAPLLSALLARAFLYEALAPLAWIGMALALGGVLLTSLVGPDRIGFRPGAAFGFAAAAATASYIVLSKRLLSRYGPLDLTAYGVWTGLAASIALAPSATAEAATMPYWTAAVAIYLGAIPTALCYALWSFALDRGTAAKVSSLLFLQPPFTVAVAWAAIGERPTMLELLGGGTILAGVLAVNMSRKVGHP